MPKGDSKGRKGKGPARRPTARRPTARHVLSEDLDQSDTDMSNPSPEDDTPEQSRPRSMIRPSTASLTMPKGDSKGRKGKGPARRPTARRPTARHVLSEDPDKSETDRSNPTSEDDTPEQSRPRSMIRPSTASRNILKHHTDMVSELSKMFSQQWLVICSRVGLSNKVMGNVNDMFGLCKALMKEGIINYGEYSKLREILVTFDVEAGETIDKYTKMIRGESEAKRQRTPDKQRKRHSTGQPQAKQQRTDEGVGQPEAKRQMTVYYQRERHSTGQPQAKQQRTVHNQRKRHSTVSRDPDKPRGTFAENSRSIIEYAQGLVRPFGNLTGFNMEWGLNIRKVDVRFTVQEDIIHLKKYFQRLIGQMLGVDYRIVNVQMFIDCTIVSFDKTGATHPLDESALALAERFTTGLKDGSILLTDETGNPLQIQQESIEITMKETPDEGNDLPVEILQMDQQSIQLYRKCLEEKEEEDYRLRLIVIGQTEVGKTTLTRNLLRLPQIIPHTESTDGVDIHNSLVNLDNKDWITDAGLQNAGKCLGAKLIQSLKSIASKNTASKSDDVSFSFGEYDNDDQQDTGADSNTEDDKSAQTASKSDDVSFSPGEYDNDDQQNAGHARPIQSLHSTASKNTEADPDDLQNLGPSTPDNEPILKKTLRNLFEDLESSADHDYTKHGELSVWDFAGQFVFYTTHHTFLTHRAVYLLVTRLDQNINDTVSNDQCFIDATGCKEMKIKDFVSYWMNSVHLYSGAAEHLPGAAEHPPPVILVGTHLDKVEGDIEKKTKTYFEDLRRYLLDMESPTSSHLIDTDYTVSNPPNELEIGNLRQKIVDLASKQAYWGEKIPAKWITLEKALMEKKIEGVNIMSYDNVVELDKSTGVPIDDQKKIDLFLRFQHAKGNMIYFSEGCLRDHIVINPQWLIDAFKCIITAPQFCTKNPALVKHWKALDKTGKLYLGLVDEIFRREDKFCRHKEHILGLMERLHIISHQVVDKHDDKNNTSEDFYFVPSLLKDKVIECEIENYVKGTNGTPYLCYVFENNFLPTAVFHRLIAACLSEYTVAKQGSKFLIFCGCGIFDLNGGLTRLVVAFYDSVIQIGLFWLSEGGCAPETSTCVLVRQFVTETLERVLRRYDMKLPFTLNLKCEKSHHLSHEGLLSVDVITGDEKVVCDDHEKKRHIINRDSLLHLWFPDKVSATDTNQGDPLRLTEQDLQHLASCFGSGWEMFVGQLGVGSETVDQKKMENSTHVPSQVYNCLLVWFRKCPTRPTITVFDQTLQKSLDLCSVNMDKYKTLKREIENR